MKVEEMEVKEIEKVKIITLKWKKIDIDREDNFCGVYQIYGDSPIYGQNTLLYIGKANNVRTRIASHLNSDESFIGRQPNLTSRYAKVEPEYLDIVEQILIVMHKPSFNSARIINISKEYKQCFYLIQNLGERGMLSLEVSNFFFLDGHSLFVVTNSETSGH